MKPETTNWFTDLRLQAIEPGTVFVTVASRAGRLLLYPDEILDRSDEQLLALLRQKLAEMANACVYCMKLSCASGCAGLKAEI